MQHLRDGEQVGHPEACTLLVVLADQHARAAVRLVGTLTADRDDASTDELRDRRAGRSNMQSVGEQVQRHGKGAKADDRITRGVDVRMPVVDHRHDLHHPDDDLVAPK
jgi:hypothetical protein